MTAEIVKFRPKPDPESPSGPSEADLAGRAEARATQITGGGQLVTECPCAHCARARASLMLAETFARADLIKFAKQGQPSIPNQNLSIVPK